MIFQNEKTPFQAIKTRSFKSRKINIFPKGLTDGFAAKMAVFPFFFLGNKGQENVFYDMLERKNAFLGFKNKKFKKPENRHFSKGLTHGFGPKMAIFSIFFFVGNKGQENVFMIFFNEKRFFQAMKIRSSNSRKIEIFLMVSVQELPFFQLFFLGNLGQEKVFYDILEEENVFLGLKNQKFKKSNN